MSAKRMKRSRKHVQLKRYSVAQKIEMLLYWQAKGWSASEAFKRLKVPRATLIGWRDTCDILFASSANPLLKCSAKPGKPLCDHEAEIVNIVVRNYNIDQPMLRVEIISLGEERMPDLFANRSTKAKKLWLTRFLKRHGIQMCYRRAPRRSTGKRMQSESAPSLPLPSSPSSSSPAPGSPSPSSPALCLPPSSPAPSLPLPSSPVSSSPALSSPPSSPAPSLPLPSSPTSSSPASSLPSTSSSSSVSDVFGTRDRPIILLDGDAEEEESNSRRNAKQSRVLCDTRAVCFVPGTTDRRLALHAQDLQTLDAGTWLNDVMITFYIREFITAEESVFNFDCQLFGYLLAAYDRADCTSKARYNSCRRLTATFDWTQYRHVLIPVCMNFHWTFVVIQNPLGIDQDTPTIIYHVDSFGGLGTRKIVSILSKYLSKERKAKFGEKHTNKITHRSISTSPAQDNGFDCGVFTLYFMKRVNEAIAANPDVDLSTELKSICSVPSDEGFDSATFRNEIKDKLISFSKQ